MIPYGSATEPLIHTYAYWDFTPVVVTCTDALVPTERTYCGFSAVGLHRPPRSPESGRLKRDLPVLTPQPTMSLSQSSKSGAENSLSVCYCIAQAVPAQCTGTLRCPDKLLAAHQAPECGAYAL
jgi:hypothetical protein